MENLLTTNHHFALTGHVTEDEKYKKRADKDKYLVQKNIMGSIFYIVVFVIIIPLLISKLKIDELLLSYLANVDFLATILSFKYGPFNSEMFEFLYLDDRPLIGFFSQNLINYIVLFTMGYIITKDSAKTKKMSSGLSKFAISLFATYLLPGRFVVNAMHEISNLIDKYFPEKNILWFVVVFIGICIATFFISLEAFLIRTFSKDLAYLIDKCIG